MVLGFTVSRAKDRSGQDLGLLTLELLGRDDTPVAQVSELGQLFRRALLACGLLDIAAERLVLLLSLLRSPLMHAPAAGDQVDQDTDQRDEQHEQEPQRFGPAGQVMAAEDVDEHGDQDPEPDHQQEDLQDRPEHPEQRVGVRTRSEQHGVSLARSHLASAAGGRMVNVSAMIVLGSAGTMLADTLTEEGYRLACPMPGPTGDQLRRERPAAAGWSLGACLPGPP